MVNGLKMGNDLFTHEQDYGNLQFVGAGGFQSQLLAANFPVRDVQYRHGIANAE